MTQNLRPHALKRTYGLELVSKTVARQRPELEIRHPEGLPSRDCSQSTYDYTSNISQSRPQSEDLSRRRHAQRVHDPLTAFNQANDRSWPLSTMSKNHPFGRPKPLDWMCMIQEPPLIGLDVSYRSNLNHSLRAEALPYLVSRSLRTANPKVSLRPAGRWWRRTGSNR